MLSTRGRGGLSALFMRKPSSRGRNIYAALSVATVGGNGRTNGAREMARRVRQMQSGKCIDPKAQGTYADAMRAF
jgi:hypothetical protein